MKPLFQQITIVGTGLIGGSFGLAVKKHNLATRIIGCDRAEMLHRAEQMKAIDKGDTDPLRSCKDSELVLLATPVGAIIDLIERLGPVLPESALLTDTGSTKSEIVDRAQSVFGSAWHTRFLPGHPMAGKELSGIENADADLFAGATWLFTTEEQPLVGERPLRAVKEQEKPWASAPGIIRFLELVRSIGATVLHIETDMHDRICAYVSHLQQFVATAMASLLVEMKDELGGDFHSIGGRALSEMTRIASSPYSMWRDIAFTNTENIEEALLRMEQKVAYIRENLRTLDLREEFKKANSFHHGDTEPQRKA